MPNRKLLPTLLLPMLLCSAASTAAGTPSSGIPEHAPWQAADDPVRCAAGDADCAAGAEADGRRVVFVDEKGDVITDDRGYPVTSAAEAARRTDGLGEGVWRNYDFVPGSRVLASPDLATQPVGRFPADVFTHVRGNLQIVEVEGKHWLDASSTSVVRLTLPEETGDSYTIEFHVRIPTRNLGVNLFLAPLEGARRHHPHDFIHISDRPALYREGDEIAGTDMPEIPGRVVPVKLQVDGGYGILYVGSVRVAQVTEGRFPSTRTLEFHMAGNDRFHSQLTDVVVAAGVDDLYDSLSRDGSFTTRGILFDVDSARLRAESTRVLEDLAAALERGTGMSVAIEGHTDASGDDAYNQALSERRARAVVEWLVARGIDASRLTPVGMGEIDPVATNETPEGRQENRRVVVRVTSEG